MTSVLENDENITAGVDEFKVLDNVGVIESPEDFDFSLDLIKDTLTLNLSLVQNFDGYLMLCDFIDRHYTKKQ